MKKTEKEIAHAVDEELRFAKDHKKELRAKYYSAANMKLGIWLGVFSSLLSFVVYDEVLTKLNGIYRYFTEAVILGAFAVLVILFNRKEQRILQELDNAEKKIAHIKRKQYGLHKKRIKST